MSKILITSHNNADFDAFASMIGASILYPDALLLFPNTQEPKLQEYFEEVKKKYNFVLAKDLDFTIISHLVIVDTAQKSRLTHVQKLLDLKEQGYELFLEIWDHHQIDLEDFQADLVHLEIIGSCSSLIVEEIQKRKLELDELSANILALGIYADTGSLTYVSTSQRDVLALAYLFNFQLKIQNIANIIEQRMTAQHLELLNILLNNIQSYDFDKVKFSISFFNSDEYINDIASLAHRVIDIEECDVFILLAEMENKIHIIARSRSELVNVANICKLYGGGGHHYAASAVLKNKTIPELKNELYQYIYAKLESKYSAYTLMTSPVISLDEEQSLLEADVLMCRYGLKAIPITSRGQVVGLIEYQLIRKALAFNLGLHPISIYMQNNIRTVQNSAKIDEIIEIIVEARQRLVPVLENETMVGVISRTDLIHLFVEEPTRIPKTKSKNKNVMRNIINFLPRSALDILDQAGEIADQMGVSAYVVGGFVRDVLMDNKEKNWPNLDLDLVIEGDGIEYAELLAQKLKAKLKVNKKFLTSMLIGQDANQANFRIDIATARLEYYEYPAALPVVELSSIKMDLFRRDFTINAMAIQINQESFGELIDFFNGQNDIKQKVIRVLHSLSFVDDPTRLLRAVRFAERYEFNLSSQCEHFMRNSLELNLISKLSGTRISHELELMLEEGRALQCLLSLNNFNLLEKIHSSLVLTENKKLGLEKCLNIIQWYKLFYFKREANSFYLFLLCMCKSLEDLEAAALRLDFSQNKQDQLKKIYNECNKLHQELNNWYRSKQKISELYKILIKVQLESILFILSKLELEELKKYLVTYIHKWQFEKIYTSGKDLLDLGLETGPIYGQILQELLAAKLDAIVFCKEDELEYLPIILEKLNESTINRPQVHQP